MIKKLFLALLVLVLLVSVFTFTAVVLANEGNLVKNPGFEEVKNGQPVDWSYVLDEGATVNLSDDAHSGSKSIKIINSSPVDTMVRQDIKVSKGKLYKVSAWVKAKIKNQAGSANITLYYVDNNSGCKGIYTSRELMDTAGKWEKIEFSIKSNKEIDDPLTLAVRLGGQGTPNEGEVYFDDVELIEIDEKSISPDHIEFQTIKAEQVKNEKEKEQDQDKKVKADNKGPATNYKGGIKYFLLSAILILIIIFLNKKEMLFGKDTKALVNDNDESTNNKVDDKKLNEKKSNTNKKTTGSFFDDED